jgi:hypothetical protein
MAARLCTVPVRLGTRGAPGVPGGYPLTGSVGKTPAPMSPAPAAPIRAGPAWVPVAGSPARDSPAAPARNKVPVTAKFAAWAQPRDPSASELTG